MKNIVNTGVVKNLNVEILPIFGEGCDLVAVRDCRFQIIEMWDST